MPVHWWWQMLAPDKKRFLLERACEYGHLNLDELIQWCRDGNAQFFDTDNGSAISVVIISGGVKTLHCMAMGATNKGMKELREKIIEFAKIEGCRYLEAKGRIGFEKARIKRYKDAMEGFEPVGILYEMDLAK